MLVVFRTDASMQIGTGHVMRCLALASALQTQGATCHFICREHAGNLIDLLKARGFTTHRLPQKEGDIDIVVDPGAEHELAHAHWLGASWKEDAEVCKPTMAELSPNWLVIDHYALDYRWERSVLDSLTGSRPQLLVIDDLADRSHVADVLLDQNLGRTPEDYKRLVPTRCHLLIGPTYALLRKEFSVLRKRLFKTHRTKGVRRVLITMGGVDHANTTCKVLDALKICSFPVGCRITVVMGAKAPWVKQVRHLAATMPWKTDVRVGISDISKLMAESDIAIAAAGSTSWELCCLGVPSLLVCVANNQVGVVTALGAQEAAVPLAISALDKENQEFFRTQIEKLTEKLALYAGNAAQVTDGLGVERVTERIIK